MGSPVAISPSPARWHGACPFSACPCRAFAASLAIEVDSHLCSAHSQLNKEKQQRRQWAVHGAQKEVFDATSAEFSQLDQLRGRLEDLTAEPSKTGKSEVSEAQQPSRRKQLVALRNEMRETLKNVDEKLATADADAQIKDPVSLSIGAHTPEAPSGCCLSTAQATALHNSPTRPFPLLC